MAQRTMETGVNVKKDITVESVTAKGNVEEREFTDEETKNQMRLQEEDFIQGLINAAGYSSEESQRVEIVREGKLYFAFNIRPLGSEEYDKCKKKHTKYVRNKQLGMTMPGETNRIKYQSAIIYEATVKEDKDKLWDNRRVWDTLNAKGFQIMNGLDVIEYALKAGEKDKILEAIDKLSGFDDSLEEVAKN